MEKVFKNTLRVLLRLHCGHRDPRPEVEDTGEPPSNKLVTEASNGGTSDKPMRMSLREKSVATDNKLTADKCDGVIIVFKQHPGALLIYISKVSLSF